ncbi:MAG: flagellar hook-associated protein FlgL [Synergistaceae bacterium]|jgi:flagellin-like hook-associated protein FlgL|nr:flagellar hook-associated protein FlgL [Synergistaceae bacterium]
MTYRVTNGMMRSLMLNDMHTNLNKLLDIQQQLSTQKKYQYASQNPNAVTKGMNLETMMAETDQYISNLQSAVSWLKFTDDALSDMNDLFVRIRELAVQGGDGALESADRDAIGKELREIKDALLSTANSAMGGNYIFAGLKTGTAPFTVGPNGDIVYNGGDYALNWEFARQQTGKVSLTGREVFPLDETTNRLVGIETAMDFTWTGRSEILEFKVGSGTVKVRIPEKWTDEMANGVTDTADYNRYRDPGEPLEGWSLDEIADMINGSTEMGDVSKLLKATVVKDFDRGVQYLQIQSLTGEPVRLTSWPETDPINVSKGIKGAAYGDPGRVASSDGTVTIRFGDNSIYSIDVEKDDTLEDIADKLNSLQDGKIWASYKSDGTNEWIDVVARNPDDSFTITTTGGATQFFATQQATVQSQKEGGVQTVKSFAFSSTPTNFETLSDGVITIEQGYNVFKIPIPQSSDMNGIVSAISAYKSGNPNFGLNASVAANGALVITADTADGEAFSVTADGGLVPLFSDGVHASSNGQANSDGKYTAETAPLAMDFELEAGKEGALAFEYGGKKYWLDLTETGSLKLEDEDNADIADKLQSFLDTISGLNATVTVQRGLNDDGEETQWLLIETASGPFKLSGFKGAADATDIARDFVVGSRDIVENADHTHIGFAAMMQMETALKSVEIPVSASGWNTTAPDKAVHLNFVSGNKTAEVFIADDPSLTLDKLAARINSVCGDWLQAVVETDGADGTAPFLDPLGNSGENAEGATKRLILRTVDGEPFAVYDGLGKTGAPAGDYAAQLGIGTALTIENKDLWDTNADAPLATGEGYPSDGTGFFEENMPAILKVTVGDREFEVKVCKNNRYNGKLVAEAIRDQVNEQYGGKLLGVGESISPSGNHDKDTYSVYALSGEPLRVVDAAYGDPRFSEYTGGIATQLGINAGITATTPMVDTDTFGPGLIRISTPGRSIDVPVLAGENLQTIANRIRDYAGSWLDVSFSDSDIVDPNNIVGTGGTVRLAIAAKDGSAVSVFDVNGSAAKTMGLDTGLVGTDDLKNFNFSALAPDSTLTITVNGAAHTIDLWDSNSSPPGPVVSSVEELADMINTRFQGQDIRAEVLVSKDATGAVTEKRLAIWSPKGYNFELSGTGDIPVALGFTPGENTASNDHGNGGPFNQNVTYRTGNNTYDIDFFGVMDNLINTVEGGNVDGLSDTILSQLDSWFSTLLKCRAQEGALTNRYETAVYRMTSNNTSYTDLYTQTVGIDLAEAFTNFEMSASVYQATLAAIAQMLQPSLLNFLS